jgi:hypothetical protein
MSEIKSDIQCKNEQNVFVHEEHILENSLTCPDDRDTERSYKPNQNHPPLTDSETEAAVKCLSNTDFIKKFPSVERKYADPVMPMQMVGLISFVPAKGAIPNKNGVYGFSKIRGVYPTTMEANERAEYLIRNVDSYHQIYHTYVGRPFPLTTTSKYSAETSEVDIRRETTAAVSANIKQKKNDEQKVVNEIKEREEALILESKREESDPYEDYITMRVKMSQIGFTYIESEKKMVEMKEIILRTRDELEKMDSEFPDFKGTYIEKYMKARSDAGIKEDSPNNFIAYLGSDLRQELGW